MEHLLGIDLGGWLDKGVTLVVAVIIALVIQRVVVRLMHRVLDASNLPSASIFINIVRALICVPPSQPQPRLFKRIGIRGMRV